MKSQISRRKFLKGAGLGAGAALAAMAAPQMASAGAPEAASARPSFRPAAASATLTYWTPLSSNVAATLKSYNDMTCYKELEKITDVHIDFQHVTDNPQAQEAFNLLVASGKYPDIIEYNWLNQYAGGPARAVKDGLVLRLNEFIDGGKLPAFAKVLADHPEWKRMIQTDEGDIYAFPFLRGDPGLQTFFGPYVRKDYLDKLGIQNTPKTMDDWAALFKAMKGKDLNGNGKADEYPFTSWMGQGQNGFSYSGAFVGAFGTTLGFYNDGGKVKFGPVEPAFRDFIALMADWWKQGFFHPDTFTMDSKAFDAQMTNGNISSGVLFVGSGIGRLTTLSRGANPKFKLQGVQYPSLKPGGRSAFGQLENAYPGGSSAAITSACTNVDAALKVLDYPYSQPGHMLFNFGKEGEQYDMVKGFPKWRDAIVKPPKLPLAQSIAQHARSNFAGPFVQDIRYLQQYFAFPEQKAAYETWSKEDHSRIMPPVTPTQAESRRFGKIMTEVNARVQEVFAKVVTNAVPLETWDAFVGELKALGIDEAIGIQQAALGRYKARK
jgi:putative aldouronate transport system substrate-binding protein